MRLLKSLFIVATSVGIGYMTNIFTKKEIKHDIPEKEIEDKPLCIVPKAIRDSRNDIIKRKLDDLLFY